MTRSTIHRSAAALATVAIAALAVVGTGAATGLDRVKYGRRTAPA